MFSLTAAVDRASTGIRRMGLSSSVFLLSSAVASLLHYAYLLAMGNLLGVVQYGELAALISLFILAALPASGLDLLVTRRTVEHLAADVAQPSPFVSLLKPTLIVGGLLFVTVLALTPLLRVQLEIDSNAPFLVVAVGVFLSYLLALGWGTLRAQQRLLALSFSMVLYPVLRILLGVALVMAGLGLFGAVSATTAGIGLVTVLALALGYSGLRSSLGPQTLPIAAVPPPLQPATTTRWYGLESIAVALCLAAPVTLDVVFVKSMASAEDAGLFAAAGAIGKGVLVASSAIGLLIFPKVAERQLLGESSRGLLASSLALTAVMSGAFALAVFLAAPTLFPLLFGAEFAQGVNLVRWYALAIIPFALISIVARYDLAIGGQRSTINLIAFTAVLTAGMGLTARNPLWLISTVGMLSLGYLVLFQGFRFAVRKSETSGVSQK